MRSRFRNSAACIAFVSLGMAAPNHANADTYSYYAQVYCREDQAQVVFSEVSGKPAFDGDPSHCVLSNGQHVTLRQDEGSDARGAGQCGAEETYSFSLWIGLNKIYSRERFRNKCNLPYSITDIKLTQTTITECRIHPDRDGKSVDTIDCVDQSQRLGNPIRESGPLGKLLVLRTAQGKEQFCRNFITERHYLDANWYGAALDWPVYRALGQSDEVFAYSNDVMTIDESNGLIGDLDNDGHIDRVVAVDTWEGGEQATVLVPASENASDQVRHEIEEEISRTGSDQLQDLRLKGLKIFAIDQTAFKGEPFTHLDAFTYQNMTWVHAKILPPRDQGPNHSTDLVLRPTPQGGLEEICAFRQTPRL